jgi:hypothetical protein
MISYFTHHPLRPYRQLLLVAATLFSLDRQSLIFCKHWFVLLNSRFGTPSICTRDIFFRQLNIRGTFFAPPGRSNRRACEHGDCACVRFDVHRYDRGWSRLNIGRIHVHPVLARFDQYSYYDISTAVFQQFWQLFARNIRFRQLRNAEMRSSDICAWLQTTRNV